MDSSYKTLLGVIVVNAFVMFALTYTTAASFEHIYANINRMYMAVMMVAAMGVLMLVAMRSMFKNRKANYILYAAFTGICVASFWLIRTQTPVGDTQFLRSMIPHHSSAILMCEKGSFTHSDIAKLCLEIVKSQKDEIAQMKALLARLN